MAFGILIHIGENPGTTSRDTIALVGPLAWGWISFKDT
jgi:hypothetical protein